VQSSKFDNFKPLEINGMMATPARVKDRTYPFLQFMYMITTKNKSPSVKKYVDYLFSQREALFPSLGYMMP
jgi:ABC-type phosphate transport system substrate-binding protein